MKNQIQKLFLYFLAGIVLFVAGFAVFGPEGKKISVKEIDFQTSESSELYFKNMRSYFYDQEERKDANFMLYRIDSREKIPQLNHLSFLLVNNWLMDECYIVAESKHEDFTIVWDYDEEKGRFSLDGKDNRSHYLFAANLFEQLDRNASIWIEFHQRKHEFSQEERASLKTSLKDYFKLVGKLR